MATWEFAGSEPINLDLSLTSGTAAITAAQTDLITVSVYRSRHDAGTSPSQPEHADSLAHEVHADYSGGRLTITEADPHGLRWRKKDLHYVIVVPVGSRCAIRSVSADVTIEGEVGSLDVTTASGPVGAEAVLGATQVTTISGAISLGALRGDSGLQTASGKISVRHAYGDVAAKTVSGAIRIDSAAGSVSARTASGRVTVGGLASGRTDVTTVSGDVELQVAPQTGVYLDLSSLSGRVTSDLEPSGDPESTDLVVQCRSVSGGVRVARALPADVAV